MKNYATILFCNVNKTQYAKLRKAFNLLTSVGIDTDTAVSIIMDAYLLNQTRLEEERRFQRASHNMDARLVK